MLSYGLAVLVSMVVALTVTPALCLLLLSRGKLASKESPLMRVLKRALRRASGAADPQAAAGYRDDRRAVPGRAGGSPDAWAASCFPTSRSATS